MKIASIVSIALAAGLSVAAWTSEASAAVRDAGAARGAGASRDTAVTRCLAQAQRHYPGKYYDWGADRDYEYQACMFDAGFPP